MLPIITTRLDLLDMHTVIRYLPIVSSSSSSSIGWIRIISILLDVLLPMSIILTILNIGNGVWVVTANAQYETFYSTGFAYTSTDETATNWQLSYTQVSYPK